VAAYVEADLKAGERHEAVEARSNEAVSARRRAAGRYGTMRLALRAAERQAVAVTPLVAASW
jgi:hypothetical protein